MSRLEVECDIADLYNQRILSSRLGYQLRRLAAEGGRSLTYAINHAGQTLPQNAVSAETLRLIGRKQGRGGRLLDEADYRALLNGQIDLRAMVDELVIGRQFAEARAMATADWLYM